MLPQKHEKKEAGKKTLGAEISHAYCFPRSSCAIDPVAVVEVVVVVIPVSEVVAFQQSL